MVVRIIIRYSALLLLKMNSLFSVCIATALLVIVWSRTLQAVPEGWYKTIHSHCNEQLTVTFAIKQINTDWLEQKLKAVSYPDSPEYTNYMNFDEIAEHVYGRPDSVEAILKTLASVGIDERGVHFTLGRDFAVVDLPVVAAKQLFSADFYHYKHESFPELEIIASPSFEMPKSLVGHIDFISGISSFPAFLKHRTTSKWPLAKTDLLVTTPITIARDYNTSDYVSTNAVNSQAVAAFLDEYYNPNDLTEFQERYKLPVKQITKVVGTNMPDDPGAEASLDVQYISATGQGVNTWFISISASTNVFLSWIVSQVNTTDSPWVHSVSYGEVESVSKLDYIQRVEKEFMKFGISGRTILFASGDSGTSCEGLIGQFTPEWPTSSPYVTSVGGTISISQVWSSGGGGFSNVFPMPDYQKQAIEAYLNSGVALSTKMFNSSGRAYPDVSAFSTDFEIIEDGILYAVDGTSCSTPTFAGIVSSLNDVRLNNGKKTLGFLNPLLYQTLMGRGFFDITEGSNGGSFLCDGFEATEGWDPASGWGSPNFGVLKSLVREL